MRKLPLVLLALLSLPSAAGAQGIGVPSSSSASVLINPLQKTPSAAPTSICSTSSYALSFTCDLSQLNVGLGALITGSATLGQPTSTYQNNPNLALLYGYFTNGSGFNNSTSGNTGRTNGAALFVKADAVGQGDTSILYGNVFVNGAKPGATSFLANPAGQILTGGVSAGQAGVYLQPLGDLNCTDNGFDVACIGGVFNLNRTVNTGALGATWLGARIQSTGSAAIDAGFSLSGLANVGLDVSNASLGTNQAGITFKADQRFYGAATGGNFFPSAIGNSYFSFASSVSSWQFVSGGAVAVTIGNSYLGVINPTSVNTGDHFGVVGSSNGSFGMTVDNSNSGTSAVTLLNIGNNTATNEVQFALNGGAFSGGLGANAFAIKLGGTSLITMSGTSVALPSVATGTPTASLCIDASNNIIKKTTAGSCI